MTLAPIGVVRSPVRERKAFPSWGVPAQVELFPEFEPALLRIEKHTHLWVIAWLDSAPDERSLLQVKPRGSREQGPEALHGVFAVRSPARPNPIGLTSARVLARDGLTLHFDRLDFLDGTKVIDLKPYFTSRDCIFSAHNERLGGPVDNQAVREGLLIQAAQFLGTLTPDAALAVRVIEHYRIAFHAGLEPLDWRIAAPLGRPEMVDALMGMTRISLGRRTLTLHAPDVVEIGHKVLYALKGYSGNILEAPEIDLFEYKQLSGEMQPRAGTTEL